MGKDVPAVAFSREDRRRYRVKVRRCLDVLARMLRESAFSTDLGLKLNLVDADVDSVMNNAAVLEAIGDPAWQTEFAQFNLARFNIEINLPPRHIDGRALSARVSDLADRLNRAAEAAAATGSHPVMIGILPTLSEKHGGAEALSPNPRYAFLDEQILAAREEHLHTWPAAGPGVYAVRDFLLWTGEQGHSHRFVVPTARRSPARSAAETPPPQVGE